PSFRSGTTRYTAQVGSGTARVSITATLQDPTATLNVDGQGSISGQARAIDLGDPGSSKDITIVVTAPNGSLKSYLVTVVRAALGGNFNLGKLTVSPGTLDPSFKASTTRYTVNVGSGTDRVMVTATPQESSSTLQVNGQVANSGQARTIDLQDPGLPTDIEVLVIAQNGSRQPYVITMNRAALSADNNLSALTVSPGTLAPAFDSDQLTYTVEVATGVTSVNVAATKSDPNAVISEDIPNGGQANIPLDGPGTSKNVSIIVTAPNGTAKTYGITVHRLAPSTDSNLANLTVSAGTLNPGFSSGTLTYTVTVPASVDSLTVTATKSDQNAVMSSSGSVIAPAGVSIGSVSSSLGLGTTTTIQVTVRAQDTVTAKDYTINVFRDSR
ncbi:MAG: cadherin-like beta sandwich domain-containing protein, partial [Nitrospira sp.]